MKLLIAIIAAISISAHAQGSPSSFAPLTPLPPPILKVYVYNIVVTVHVNEQMPYLKGQCESECGMITRCHEKTLEVWAGLASTYEQRIEMFHELLHLSTACEERDEAMHATIYRVSKPMVDVLSDKRNRALVKWLFDL